jgi:DNA-binding NtrC family response regulator
MDARRAAAGQIVLIVDDEPLQRMTVADMLYEAGFWTVEASDADQAIRMLESRDDIRIVFLDIVMSHGMDGLELAKIVRERWPHVNILLTSGKMYASDAVLPDRAVFFHKPYRSRDVVPVLHKMAS